MSFKKGQSGNPKGKKKGQVSKFTSSFKEALRIAFDGIGGAKNLTEWARENPTEFYKIMARLIPVEVSGSISHTMEASELSDDRLAHIATAGCLTPAIAQEGPRKSH